VELFTVDAEVFYTEINIIRGISRATDISLNGAIKRGKSKRCIDRLIRRSRLNVLSKVVEIPG